MYFLKISEMRFCIFFSFVISAFPVFGDESNQVIATIAVGASPNGMAITPDSCIGYVANNNDPATANGSSVSVVDLLRNKVITTIYDPGFDGPYAITMNGDGTKVYVANSNIDTVSIIDVATNKVSGQITGFNGPSGFAISPDGTLAYVNNYGSVANTVGTGCTVNVVDLVSNTIIGSPIGVGLAPAVVVLSQDGAYLYVVCYNDGNEGDGFISILSTQDNTVEIEAIAGFFGPYAAAMHPNGQYLYVTNFGSNDFSPVGTTVSVVDLQAKAIVNTISLGIQPAGIGINSAEGVAYVSNYDSLYNGAAFSDLIYANGGINMIDLKTNQVSNTIIGGLGLGPSAIIISPNKQRAYVTNYASNTISVIQLPSPLYNLNRLTPFYETQKQDFLIQLEKAGLK